MPHKPSCTESAAGIVHLYVLLAIAAIMLSFAGGQRALPQRHFRLGFSPFPYDISAEALDFSYHALAKDADLVLHHLDQGIPWDEAYRNVPFPPSVKQDWEGQRRRTPKGCAVYLALTPINQARDGMAADLSSAKDPNWSRLAFDDPKVERAYLNYCRRAISFFHPAYLAIGVESNLIRSKAPQKWSAYLGLHRTIYNELKRSNRKLPIFDTLVATALLVGYSPEYDHAQQMAALDDLMPTSDIFALSLYPYMSVYTTNALPDDMFQRLAEMSHGRRTAIAESGYPARLINILHGKLRMQGTDAKQAAWIKSLLAAADARHYLFVVNYIIRDYDPLWEKTGRTDLNALWKNTGLYDVTGAPRPSLTLWREALKRPYR